MGLILVAAIEKNTPRGSTGLTLAATWLADLTPWVLWSRLDKNPGEGGYYGDEPRAFASRPLCALAIVYSCPEAAGR